MTTRPEDPEVAQPAPRGLVPPVIVHLCWHRGPQGTPECAAIARELYEFLHRPIGDDPVQRPGLEIPVQYGRDLGGLLDALAAGSEAPADARVVVMVLDGGAFGSPDCNRVVRRAMARWTGSAGSTARAAGEVFLPVVLDDRWHSRLTGGAGDALAGITVGSKLLDPENRCWRLGSDVAVVVGRALLRARGQADAIKPQIFISHTKAGGEQLGRGLAHHIKTQTRIEAWFDENDIERGDELVRQLTRAASHGVFVVVRTDRYSDSSWCALELLAAKRARIPIITVLATAIGEPSTSAYSGNHRTVAWSAGREWEVVGRCVQGWLHFHYFTAHAMAALAHAGLPADATVLARRPELLDLSSTPNRAGRSLVVYPDPPIPEDEAQALRDAQPSIRLVTPNTMLGRVLLANDPRPPLADCELAFSLSAAEDMRDLDATPDGTGLTHAHLDDVIYTIVLTTLYSGARIAYGGDFRKGRGYALQLSELHKARRRLGIGVHSQLVCFLDEGGERAGDARVEYEPVIVPARSGFAAHPKAVRDTLWRTTMRHSMAARGAGRVLAGGQALAAASDAGPGYLGPWPGVLEEAAVTLRAGKALYLLGAFGGFGRLLTRMLLDERIPEELTAAYHAGSRLARLAAEVDLARTELVAGGAGGDEREVFMANADGTFAGIDQLAREVLNRWQSFVGGDAGAWSNGLNVDENRRLFQSTDRTEIAHLVFQGLRAVMQSGPTSPPAPTSAPAPTPELTLALYHGNIASVDKVDGYVVTTTPGLPNIGAMAALDAAMSGRLGQAAAETRARGPVAGVAVQTDALAGRHAFVARLDLPTQGGAIKASSVESLARRVGQAANRLGIESLAAAPFGTTMGVPAELALKAMLSGLQRGRGAGAYPRTLVLCEVDRVRYEALKAAATSAGITVRELRAGPLPATRADSVVLHADAEPLGADGAVRLTLTVYPPDGDAAVVPREVKDIEAAWWKQVRMRPPLFQGSVARGQALWNDLLSSRTQLLIDRHPDRRILLVSNPLASGLPWEFMTNADTRTPATAGGLVRRIALAGDFRPPATRASTDATLRVLLVVNPTGDLPGSAAEGRAVLEALDGRRDVAVTTLEGKQARLADLVRGLREGFYDVLHYAGHAYFDKATPATSGLRLAGGDVLTGEALAQAIDGDKQHLPRLVVLGACESALMRGKGARSRSASPKRPPPGRRTRSTARPPTGADRRAGAGDAPQHSAGRPLAEALLRGGVAAMVGTFFPVGDNAAKAFAGTLHTQLAQGKTVGAAVGAARAVLHAARHPDWGNFILYGDDTLTL